MKTTLGYTPEEVIHHNLLVVLVQLFSHTMIVFLTKKYHPLAIINVQSTIFTIYILCLPFVLPNVTTGLQMFVMQSAVMLFGFDTVGATPIYYKSFPVLYRFRYCAMIYAVGRAFANVATSFGVVILVQWWGVFGIQIAMATFGVMFLLGVHHFKKREIEKGEYKGPRLIGTYERSGDERSVTT